MKPCEHCGLAKKDHKKLGRGRAATLICADHKEYKESKASFDRHFANYVKRTGPQPPPTWFMELKPTLRNGDYVITTLRGELKVTFYPDWVATRFEIGAKVQDLTESPHTNKWNWHGEGCRERFQRALTAILP